MPNEFEISDIYPIYDPKDLPIKTVQVRSIEGIVNIALVGRIGNDEIASIGNDIHVENLESRIYRANVDLTVWKNRGHAEQLDRQIIIGGFTEQDIKGKSIYIFDPCGIRLWEIAESSLQRLAQDNGHFWQIARYMGLNRILGTKNPGYQVNKPPYTEYNGFEKLSEPIALTFGINHKADTLIGNLHYAITVKPPELIT